MPEGPETRRTADSLSDVLLNETVVDFAATAKRWQAPGWCEKVIGARVERIETHGKNLLIYLSNDTVLYSHLMMWGRWRVFAADAEPPQDKRVRAWLRTAQGLAVLYNGPVFEIMRREEVDDHYRLTTLGPDVLAAAFDKDEFLARLQESEVAEMELGEALLNQRVAAGIGNYLKSEILFTTGLDPFRKVASLTDEERRRLAAHIPKLARRAYEHAGVTVAPALSRLWAERGENWYGRTHYVYRRTKRPCRRCRTPIQARQQGRLKRVTYWCPTCQR
ncbi:MAG: DNA-formamidopyrimidine glycosylase family protein [Anaerolineae bacterium]